MLSVDEMTGRDEVEDRIDVRTTFESISTSWHSAAIVV